MIDCIKETDTQLAVVTETWLRPGDKLEKEVEDLALGSGLGTICKNRKAAANGVCYGGVTIIWRLHDVRNLKEVKFPNPENHEILVAACSLPGQRRKVVTVACYLPPNEQKSRSIKALEHIAVIVVEMKRRYQDPYIIVAGDFNQWRIDDYLANFADVKEVQPDAQEAPDR